MLNHLPGCIFVAFALPALAHWGWPGLVAALAVVAVMAARRGFSLAIVAGVAVLWAIYAGLAAA
jgi:uncharacterized membrane protein